MEWNGTEQNGMEQNGMERNFCTVLVGPFRTREGEDIGGGGGGFPEFFKKKNT